MGRSSDARAKDASETEREMRERRTIARLKATTPPGTRRATVSAAARALRERSESDDEDDDEDDAAVRERGARRVGGDDDDGDSELWFVGNMRGVNVTQFGEPSSAASAPSAADVGTTTTSNEDASTSSSSSAAAATSPVDRSHSKSPIIYGMEKLPTLDMSVPEHLKEYIGVGAGRAATTSRYRCPCEHAIALRRHRRRASSDTDECDTDDTDEHASGCASHALSMFWRTFTTAYMTRAGISVAAHALRTMRSRKPSKIFDLSHLVGESALKYREEAVRFGLFAGMFVGGYNATRCGLCYATAPTSSAADGSGSKNRGGSKSSSLPTLPETQDNAATSAKSVPNIFRRKEAFTPETAAAYAGGVAGLSIFFLKPKLRRTVSLYLAAKLAQAGFESAKKDYKWVRDGPGSWEHGNLLLFTLSSAQVMYAYVMRPDTLDVGFWNFIVRSGPIDKPTLAHMRQAASRLPAPATSAAAVAASACCGDHAMLHSSTGATLCTSHVLKSAADTFQKCFPFYFSIHYVPYVVLNVAKAIKNPLTTLYRATKATVRSTTFISTYVAVYMGTVCAHRNLGLPNHRSLYYIAGIIAGGALLVENKSRRTDLALWLMPRAVDSLVLVMLHKGLLPRVPNFDAYVFALVMGATMNLYEQEPDTLEPNLRAFIARFVEPPVTRKFSRNSSVGFM